MFSCFDQSFIQQFHLEKWVFKFSSRNLKNENENTYFGRYFEMDDFFFFFCWIIVFLDVCRYTESFVRKSCRKVLHFAWVQVDLPCAQMGVKSKMRTEVLRCM